MNRQLIVNADDLGLTINVTRGIIQAHKQGIVTSASVMVNLAASHEAVQLVMAEAPRLGLGLHINLTTGYPITSYADDLLRPDGTFASKTDLLPLLNEKNVRLVLDEMHAQRERFQELVGRPPDHLDSHHHISYVEPEITQAMVDMAQMLQVPIRKPFSKLPESLLDYLIKLNAPGIVEVTARQITEKIEGSGLAMPDYFCHSFFGNRTSLGDLLNDLADVEDGTTELMCHPGIPDEELRQISGYTEPRQRELEALTHPAAREVIIANQIVLASFEDLRS